MFKAYLTILLILSTTYYVSADNDKPNILFIIADDLATRLGCYNDRTAITPNLDKLAAEGILFSRAYTQGAVCTPSRTSFMLGMNNKNAKANHFLQFPETMTMGRWFKEHGYQTFSIGKIDHTDEYVDPRAWSVRINVKDIKTEKGFRRVKLTEDLNGRDQIFSYLGIAEKETQLHDWNVVEQALIFFENRRITSKPFFAAIGFHTPHVPWDTTKNNFEKFQSTDFILEKTPENAFEVNPMSLYEKRQPYGISEATQSLALKSYYSAVSTLDEQVGRLLANLKEKGHLENTLVVFTSDHGYHLGWRGQWNKHTLFEEVMRVPLIVSHPDLPKDRSANGIVELLDLFPTFCDFASIPIPEKLDGKSFSKNLKSPEKIGKKAAFCWWGNGKTVRTKDWRLIERKDGTFELYDHRGEIRKEFYNVAKENEQVVNKLKLLIDLEFSN